MLYYIQREEKEIINNPNASVNYEYDIDTLDEERRYNKFWRM